MLSFVYRIFQEGGELWQGESAGDIARKLGPGGVMVGLGDKSKAKHCLYQESSAERPQKHPK